MAQTGYTPIQIYSSSTPTNAPSASNLINDTKGSELAINIADKNLFFKDSTNSVNTVPIRQSGAASDGWLSSTDWNTFNNKQPAGAYLTSVTADSPLSGAGTSASHLVIAQATTSTSGYLSSTDWNTFNNKQPAGTYVTSVSGTAPVVSSGGTTPAISMAAATTSVNGYLTSTDWNTFNGKQAALVSGTNIKTVNGTTLLGSGDLGTIGVAYGGTGASTASITSFNNITGYTASGATGTTSTNLVFSTSPTLTTPQATTTIGVGAATPAASGAGITFPATQSASSDANTLDDYEEGTWTGTFTSATPPTTPITATGKYTKIGRLVQAYIEFVNVNTSGGSGVMSVTGLPFAAAASASYTAVGCVAKYQLGTSTSAAVIDTSALTTMYIVNAENTAVSQMVAGPNRYLFVSITYTV